MKDAEVREMNDPMWSQEDREEKSASLGPLGFAGSSSNPLWGPVVFPAICFPEMTLPP